MRQLHKNLFFFYRGASPTAVQKDFVFERQLEDNTTKALIYLLEHADRAKVLVPFLSQIVGLKGGYDQQEVQFALQRVDIGRPTIPRRVAIAIAPIKGLLRLKDKSHASGRPDAWIWADNKFALLLENKVNASDQVGLNQIERHIASASGWRKESTQIVSVSWEEIYKFFHWLLRQRTGLDPVSRLLLGEFLEYLKMTGIAHATSFEIDDFAFFTIAPRDRLSVQKKIVSSKLEQFTKELSNSPAIRKIVDLYGLKHVKPSSYVNPGMFRNNSTNFWITLGPKERRNHCHLTVRIAESGIKLDAFAPHKNFTRKLVREIQRNPDGFIKAFKHISQRDPFLIRLREAYYSNPRSSYKGQRISHFVDYLEIHPSFIDQHNINALIVEPIIKRLESDNSRPEIFLVRDFRLAELLGRNDVVQHVASAAEKMIRYLKFALGATRSE